MLLAGAYNQKATYWAPAAMDGFGNRTFATPIVLHVRWEDYTNLNINLNQEARVPKAKVFLLQAVALGGFLALGDYAEIDTPVVDPETIDTAYLIQQYQEVTSILCSDIIRKAIL